jgi:hypothetical protein
LRAARRALGALALLLLLTALVANVAPTLARAAAHSDTSALPAVAAGTLVVTTLLLLLTGLRRLVRFVQQLCERGKAVERARLSTASH